MRRIHGILLAVLLSSVAAAAPKGELVLIVSAHSDVTALGSASMRKLFLGLTVSRDGRRLHPLLNETDAVIKQVFLQNVVSMSDAGYDRRLLRLAIQEGRPPPTAFKDKASLLTAVAEDADAVSYAWRGDVDKDPRIRIVRSLWSD